MGKKKRTGGSRLDKYYKLAKERGYRSRSAFKLIQLNKQFKFLDKVKCLIDLCAAPGGWLQVASAAMPKPSRIIGVDLVPIKPIKDVLTFEGDITSHDCTKRLRSELRGAKADIILHDGSPNMGVSWGNDAFNQSDLVLSSLRLATEFLLPGGWFITKIFRSNDYNKLLWTFNKLFFKITSTKPASSRNESAEIYVICQGFKSPRVLDPRLLDPKYIFKELQDPGLDLGSKNIENTNSGISNIYRPEKKQRHRSGYAEDDFMLYRESPITDFVHNDNYLSILAGVNRLVFDDDQLIQLPATTQEVIELCKDLKVLGRSDFKALIRWRRDVRIQLGLDVAQGAKNSESKEQNASGPDTYEDAVEELKRMLARKKRRELKEKEKKVRAVLKQQGGYDPTSRMEIYEALNREMDDKEFDIPVDISNERGYDISDGSVGSGEHQESESEQADIIEEIDDKDRRLIELEEEIDYMYDEYIKKMMHKKRLPAGMEISGESEPAGRDYYPAEYSGSHAAQHTHGYPLDILDKDPAAAENAIAESTDVDVSEEQRSLVSSCGDPPHKDSSDIDPFTIRTEDIEEDLADEKVTLTPELIALAKQLATKAGKRRLIEQSYNRYAHGGVENLPACMKADIARNYRANFPVTREAVLQARKRAEAINARPIKKVAEAHIRRRARVSRAIKKASKTLEDIDEGATPANSEKSLLVQAKKMVDKSKMKPKKKVKVIVARGRYKRIKGRPAGVKGKYKLVDARMRKDSRVRGASKKKGSRA